MKKNLINVFLAVLVSVPGLTQTQSILTGRIKGLPDGTKVWLISNMPGQYKDSVLIKNGEFTFNGPVKDSGSYLLVINKDDYSNGNIKGVYIDNSPLKIMSDHPSLNGIVLSGSPMASEFNGYEQYLERNGVFQRQKNLAKLNTELNQKKDSVLLQKWDTELKQYRSLRDSLNWNWIQTRPSSLVSVFILYGELYVRGLKLDTVLQTLTARNNLMYRELSDKVAAYKATAIGMIAPQFVQNDTEGKPFSLASLRGSYVLIDFWASWCIPCRAENPNVIAAYNKFKDKGLVIVGVSLDKDKALWIEAIKKDGLPWKQVSDLKFWENAVAKKYYINSVPANFLIGPDGKILAKNLREGKLDTYLSGIFK